MSDLHRALRGRGNCSVPKNLWKLQAMRAPQSNQLAYPTPVDQLNGGWMVDPCWQLRGIMDERRAGQYKLSHATNPALRQMQLMAISNIPKPHGNSNQYNNTSLPPIATMDHQVQCDKIKIEHGRTNIELSGKALR